MQATWLPASFRFVLLSKIDLRGLDLLKALRLLSLRFVIEGFGGIAPVTLWLRGPSCPLPPPSVSL